MIGWLQTCVRKQPIIALYFEFENELKFLNLQVRCVRSGVRSTMHAASQRPGGVPMMWMMHLHVHQNHDDDDDVIKLPQEWTML